MSLKIGSFVVVSALLAACASPAAGTAPEATLDDLGTKQVIADNGYTAEAHLPQALTPFGGFEQAPNTYPSVYGSADFTGPGPRLMGVCLLNFHESYTPCTKGNENVDCAAAPTTIPTGGRRYCIVPDGTGQGYCGHRPGPQNEWCAGSPALTPPAAVAPQYYPTPNRSADPSIYGAQSRSLWISQACFEGCGVIPASNSAVNEFIPSPPSGDGQL